MNLFDQNELLEKQAPLAVRMRPTSLDDYVGQEHILGEGKLLRRAIQQDFLRSIILYGPPGVGKRLWPMSFPRVLRRICYGQCYHYWCKRIKTDHGKGSRTTCLYGNEPFFY